MRFFIFSIFFILFSTSSFANEDNDSFDSYDKIFSSSATSIYDPIEPLNRKIFAFNDFADQYFVGYAVDGYRLITTSGVRTGITNFFSNLRQPFTILNSILQGKFDNALSSFSSFLVNSTIGVFGIFDVASKESITFNREDFGQTLGYYGVNSGPYIVLPFLGPSNARDFSGDVIRRLSSPTSFDSFSVKDRLSVNISSGDLLAGNVIDLINKRESFSNLLADLKISSFDYYAAVRSFYSQNRQSKINK